MTVHKAIQAEIESVKRVCCKGSESALSELLDDEPRRTVQDDFIFVYKRGKDHRVFGLADSQKFKNKLIMDGWVHTQTLSASVVFENLLNLNQKGRIGLIADLVG